MEAQRQSLIGRTIGNYSVLREIGRGGMGVVYEAHEASLDRRVAVKVLSPQLALDQTFVGRFLREARAVAQLNHPNIVHIYASGEQDGLYYIAMEYVDGVSLSERIRERGRLEPEEALGIARQAARALAEAHRRDIVHRT